MAAAATTAEAPPAVAPPPGHPRFPLIDGVRAIAALSVLVFHAGAAVYVNQNGRTGRFTGHLDGGVTLFFLISGFLIYRPFLAARFLEARPPSWPDYLRRRLLRIVPAYWLAVTVIGLIIGYGGYFWSHPWVFYGFAQVYQLKTVELGLVPAWTLCVEMSFYLLLPFWALVTARVFSRLRTLRRRAVAETILLLVVGVASAVYFIHLHDAGGALETNLHLERTILATFFWFSLGMMLALASVAAQETGRPLRPLAFLSRHPWLCWSLAAAIFALIAYYHEIPGNPFGRGSRAKALEHVGYGLTAFLLLVPAVFEHDGSGLVRRFLRWRVMAWLGLVSYGIYLWHTFVITELHNHRLQDLMPGHPLVLFVGATLAGSAVLAGLSYHLLERPILRFKDRGPRPTTPPLRPAPEQAGG